MNGGGTSLKSTGDIVGCPMPFSNKKFSSNLGGIWDKSIIVAKNAMTSAFDWIGQGGFMGKSIPEEISQRLPQFGDTQGFETTITKSDFDPSKEQLGDALGQIGANNMRSQGRGR